MNRTYKIRRSNNGKSKGGKEFTNYSLTVPSEIANHIPDDMQFYCELNENGILFKPIDKGPGKEKLPKWAKR